MGRQFHHLTYKDRLHIEAYLKAKHTSKEIAALIGVHVSTINRENNVERIAIGCQTGQKN